MVEASTWLKQANIDINEVVAALPLSVEPYAVFLSGSIIEGYGTAESDLDVFVVYSTEVPNQRYEYDYGGTLISLEYISNRRLDIESWTKEQILAVAQRINHCQPDSWNECMKMSEEDILFAHQIRVGIPVRHAEHLKRLQKAFDFAHLSRIIKTQCLVRYEGVAEDASGAIVSKQYGVALLSSRQAVQVAIDALLASHGETNIKGKWRFSKLEKFGDRALLERYWALELPQIDSRDSVLNYAKECLTFGQQIILKIQEIAS